MFFFDSWARDIASGDWLTRKPLHPFVSWQAEVANIYFRENPDEKNRVDTIAHGLEPARLLWNEWYGGSQFHQEPLYPYLIAATYRLAGSDPRWVFLWQMLLGIGTNLLIYQITRRHFGETAGLIALSLATFCGPLVMYELILQRTALQVFWSLLLVEVVEYAYTTRCGSAWLGAGIVSGFGILLNSTLLPFSISILLFLAWSVRRSMGKAFHRIVPFCAGISLVLIPLVIRNQAVHAPLFSVSSVGPMAFVAVNTIDYHPEVGFWVSLDYVPRIMGKTHGRFLPAVIETMRTHPNATSYMQQFGRKLESALHWYEKPSNENFYYFRLCSSTLRCMPITFAFIGPLGLLGLCLASRRISLHLFPLLMTALAFLPLVIFYVVSRLRAPFFSMLIPFAAYAIVSITKNLRRRNVILATLQIVSIAILTIWICRPLPPDVDLIRPADYMAGLTCYYIPEAQQAASHGEWIRAVNAITEALQMEPGFVRETSRLSSKRIMKASQREVVAIFSDLHRLHSMILLHCGRSPEAKAALMRACELSDVAAQH